MNTATDQQRQPATARHRLGAGAAALLDRARRTQGIFQLASLVAVAGIFLAHLEDGAANRAEPLPLTMANQNLPGQLMGGLVRDPALFSSTPFVALMFVLFFALLVATTWHRQAPSATKSALVSVQLFIGLLFNNELLLVLAAQSAVIFRLRLALLWLLIQYLGMVVIWAYVVAAADPSVAPVDELARRVAVSLLLFAAWQTFAFCLGYVAMSERVNRERLAMAHAQLRATQQLLSKDARTSERLRIARDLHDGLGHHLTALGLHLELAARQLAPAQAPAVDTARGIARDLLHEVRAAVGRERADEFIDLEQSLRILCDGVPVLDVSLDCGVPPVTFRDPALAYVAFRCVQEAVSNALRHAQASRLWVTLRAEDGGIRVTVADDGQGTAQLEQGHGLRGMGERIETVGGRLDIQSSAGQGFRVNFWLPLQRSAP